MPREKELYEPTLESIRARAKELYPNKLIFGQREAAEKVLNEQQKSA